MIREKHQRPEYEAAACDGCGADLRQSDGAIENVNYGLLRGEFGWPSPLDEIRGGPDYHLCEACWLRVLGLLGLPVAVGPGGERYMPDGRVLDAACADTGETWDVKGAVAKAEKSRARVGVRPERIDRETQT